MEQIADSNNTNFSILSRPEEDFLSNFSQANETPTSQDSSFDSVHLAGNAILGAFLLLLISLDLLCFVALLFNPKKKFNKMIQIVLSTFILSSMLYLLGLAIVTLAFPVRFFDPVRRPESCIAGYFFQFLGGTANLVTFAELGVVTYLIVMKSKTKLQKPAYIVMITIPWILAGLSASAPFIPAYDVIIRDNSESRCTFSTDGDVHSLYVHLGLVWGLLGLSSWIINATLMIHMYRKIRKNSITKNNAIQKALLKIAALLTINTLFFILGQLFIPLLVTLFDIDTEEDRVGDISLNFFGTTVFILSQVPVPISMIAVFKPLRESLAYMLKCKFLGKKAKTLPKV